MEREGQKAPARGKAAGAETSQRARAALCCQSQRLCRKSPQFEYFSPFFECFQPSRVLKGFFFPKA